MMSMPSPTAERSSSTRRALARRPSAPSAGPCRKRIFMALNPRRTYSAASLTNSSSLVKWRWLA